MAEALHQLHSESFQSHIGGFRFFLWRDGCSADVGESQTFLCAPRKIDQKKKSTMRESYFRVVVGVIPLVISDTLSLRSRLWGGDRWKASEKCRER